MKFPPDPDEVQGRGPPLTSHLRLHDDWFEDPWAEPHIRDRRRREKHARWIASISAADWARLAALADLVLAGAQPARLDDLDASIAIGLTHPDNRHKPNGERFGTLKGCILMAWPRAATKGD